MTTDNQNMIIGAGAGAVVGAGTGYLAGSGIAKHKANKTYGEIPKALLERAPKADEVEKQTQYNKDLETFGKNEQVQKTIADLGEKASKEAQEKAQKNIKDAVEQYISVSAKEDAKNELFNKEGEFKGLDSIPEDKKEAYEKALNELTNKKEQDYSAIMNKAGDELTDEIKEQQKNVTDVAIKRAKESDLAELAKRKTKEGISEDELKKIEAEIKEIENYKFDPEAAGKNAAAQISVKDVITSITDSIKKNKIGWAIGGAAILAVAGGFIAKKVSEMKAHQG